MTLVSDDPSWWPVVFSFRFYSYFIVSAFAVVIYDCVLTLGQEIELIWRQRWSLMTFLYLSTRYIGILFAAMFILDSPSVSLSDAGCNITMVAENWINVIVLATLGVIVIVRLYAMYQGSRKMLVFLIVIFLALNITCIVLAAMALRGASGEQLILSGTYACGYTFGADFYLLVEVIWVLTTVWEVLALCLSLWIAVKHFRGLRRLRQTTGSTSGDFFTVLIKSHVLYFASFTAVSSLQLGGFSPYIANSNSVGTETYNGILQILVVVQMFVLGPRLILSVREYHAKLVATSDDTATGMASIAFQEHVHVSTSSTV